MNIGDVNELENREQLAYQQNFEHARHLNVQMNSVPTLAMTLTGGLWFGAGLTANVDERIRFALLLLAGISNLALVLAAVRIRDVMESYLEQVRAFLPQRFADGHPQQPKLPWLGSYSMISIYCALFLLASSLSFIGAFGFYWPFRSVHVAVGVFVFIVILVLLASLLFSTPKVRPPKL